MTGKDFVESLSLKEQHDKMEELMNKDQWTMNEQVQFSALIYTYLRRVHQASEWHQTEPTRFG